MGCWNGTCGISQLPIMAGEKVKAFILKQGYLQDIQMNGTCYISDYFMPWFLPLSAKYDDYGSVNDIEDNWNSQFILQYFQSLEKEKRIKFLGDDAEVNSPDIDTIESVKDIYDCMERGAILVNDGKIGIFLVIESIYDALVKQNIKSINSCKYSKKYYQEKIKQYDVIRKIREKKSAENEIFFGHGVLYNIGGSEFDFQHYQKNVIDHNFGKTEDIIKELQDFHHFNDAMKHLRKMWIPQTGKGSQDNSFEYFKTLNSAMNKYVISINKKYED